MIITVKVLNFLIFSFDIIIIELNCINRYIKVYKLMNILDTIFKNLTE